jgi:heme a synthase
MSHSMTKVEAVSAGEHHPAPRGLHRFAVLTAAATFVLIFVGGLVTSTGSALAVPDWPLSFGKFFPKMEGGVLYEHGHRMAAGTVTILTAILMAWAWRSERRAWVRYVAVAAFGLIIVQAVLGGLTVLLLLPLPIAVAHAATAQAFFCLIVALALFTNPRWESAGGAGLCAGGDRGGESETTARIALPTLTAFTTVAIYLQILIGALMRHMGAGLAIPDFPLSFGRIVPPLDSSFVAVNFAHRCGALAVTALIVWTVARVLRAYGGESWLRRPALGLLLLLAAQLCLGAITIWSERAVVPTTSHVAVGAAILAASLTLTLRVFRLRGAHLQRSEPELSSHRVAPQVFDNQVTA